MKVRVLVPNMCGTEGDKHGLAEMDDARAKALIAAGAAEAVGGVEKATASPGEKRDVKKPSTHSPRKPTTTGPGTHGGKG